MAKHVHETYTCDRCGADLPELPQRGISAMRVLAEFGSREGPGPQFQWADLCDTCDAAVKAFFVGTTNSWTQPSSAQKVEAWNYFEGLMQGGENEVHDHRLVRAYRMLQGTKP